MPYENLQGVSDLERFAELYKNRHLIEADLTKAQLISTLTTDFDNLLIEFVVGTWESLHIIDQDTFITSVAGEILKK